MDTYIYVRVRSSTKMNLPTKTKFCVKGVYSIKAEGHTWKFTAGAPQRGARKTFLYLIRMQISLLTLCLFRVDAVALSTSEGTSKCFVSVVRPLWRTSEGAA